MLFNINTTFDNIIYFIICNGKDTLNEAIQFSMRKWDFRP